MVQQWGWVNVGLFALDRLMGVMSRGNLRMYRYYLIAQPVAKTTLLPPGRGEKIEVRLINEQDEIARQFPRPAPAIQARFKQGAKCLVALKEQRFVGFLWLLLGSYQELNLPGVLAVVEILRRKGMLNSADVQRAFILASSEAR